MVIESDLGEYDEREPGRCGKGLYVLDLDFIDRIIKRAEEGKAKFEPPIKPKEISDRQLKNILKKEFPEPLSASIFGEFENCGIVRYLTQTSIQIDKKNYENLVQYYMEKLKHRIENRQITYFDTEMSPRTVYEKLNRRDPDLVARFKKAGAIVVRKRGRKTTYKVDTEIRQALLRDVYSDEERTVKDVLESIIEEFDAVEEDEKLDALARVQNPSGSCFFDFLRKKFPKVRQSLMSCKMYELVTCLVVDYYLKREPSSAEPPAGSKPDKKRTNGEGAEITDEAEEPEKEDEIVPDNLFEENKGYRHIR
ncbi:hypothetical protein KY325_05115 [Candidatus Woesearchaeota archaeon]|nr:hypothetical protein [Candidatus Woesearchaeota archaeon]MBW3018514.1 hypothetical protein [Candidatus Woesearchaeota archaeon]